MLPSIRMLRAARVLLGWSQRTLAEKSGMRQSVIGRIEGKGGSARPPTLERLARAMEKSGIVFTYENGIEGIKIHVDDPKDDEDSSES